MAQLEDNTLDIINIASFHFSDIYDAYGQATRRVDACPTLFCVFVCGPRPIDEPGIA